MDASLRKLIQIVPPPEEPVLIPESVWQELEQELGTELPDDYKEFQSIYGDGEFYQFMGPLPPLPDENNFGLLRWKEIILHQYSGHKDSFPEHCPFPVFPEPGGVLPWGSNENSDTLFWLTEGPPNDWTVVLYDDDMVLYEVFPTNMAGFLYAWISGEIDPEIFPDDVLTRNVPPFRRY